MPGFFSVLTPVSVLDQAAALIQIFPDAGVFIGVEIVRHPSDAGTRLLGMVHNIGPVEPDVTGVRHFQRGQHAHEGCFPGSIGADQADDLALADDERGIVDGFQRTE